MCTKTVLPHISRCAMSFSYKTIKERLKNHKLIVLINNGDFFLDKEFNNFFFNIFRVTI